MNKKAAAVAAAAAFLAVVYARMAWKAAGRL